MKTKKNPIFWILIGALSATLLMTLVFAVNWAALLGSIQELISNTTERVFSIDIPTTSEPASLLPSARRRFRIAIETGQQGHNSRPTKDILRPDVVVAPPTDAVGK